MANVLESTDTVTNLLDNLQLSTSNPGTDANKTADTYCKESDTRTREEILAARKQRRHDHWAEVHAQRYAQKVSDLRTPKTDKLQLITGSEKEKFHAVPAVKQAAGKSMLGKPIEVNLLDLVVMVKSKQERKHDHVKGIRNAVNIENGLKLIRHKGKSREVPKRKCLTQLKRGILQARSSRRSQAVPGEPQISSDDKSTEEVVTNPEPETSKPMDNTSKIILKGNVQHSRNFRPYCNNFITPELNKYANQVLSDVFRFQDRAFNKNEIKARAQKRFVVGFKETCRQLEIGKLKLLIVAPDLEASHEIGGIDITIAGMKTKCEEQEVPYVFALRRRKIGYILLKKVPVSCVGVINYEGTESSSSTLLDLIAEEKKNYRDAIL